MENPKNTENTKENNQEFHREREKFNKTNTPEEPDIKKVLKSEVLDI